MSKSVKLPDPVYEQAKQEAEQDDMTIGAIVDRWRWKAGVLEHMSGKPEDNQ